MHLVAILLLALGATALARIPTDLSFVELTFRYLPFVSLNTAYLANDNLASRQLANARNDPVTIFLSPDLSFLQFLAEPPLITAASRVEQARYEDPQFTAKLLQYSQLDGAHKSTSFNGTSFLTTRLKNEATGYRAKMKVFRNATNFYVESGLGYVSNVLVRDIAFANGSGILHIIDHPATPPYSLSDTAIVLKNRFLIEATLRLTVLEHIFGVTAFALENYPFRESSPRIRQYVVLGEVIHSSDLTAGRRLKTMADGILVVRRDPQGNVKVNGKKVMMTDVLTDNGVVHILEGRVGWWSRYGGAVLLLLLCFLTIGLLWRIGAI